MKVLDRLTALLWITTCCIQLILCEEDADNIMSMVTEAQYPIEKHSVETSDGYILSLHRIPSSPKATASKDPKMVAFLLHGILCSAADFVVMGPNKALAYKLADAGYDVWMANVRGTTHSRKHVSHDPELKDFWEFTWHEIGVNDLPAFIDFILKKTGQSKLYAIGHSQGSTTLSVLLSEVPAYNDKMHGVFLLAPVLFFKNPSPLVQVFGNNANQLENAIKTFDFFEIFPSRPIIHGLVTMLCDVELDTHIICRDVVFAMGGTSLSQYNASLMLKVSENSPAGSSYKQHLHYFQIAKSGKFSKYDHRSDNMKVYGQNEPPEYDLSKITAKLHVYYGDQDLMVVEKDSLYAIEQFGSNVITKERISDFNHFDFLWGNHADTLIYDKIIQTMK